MRVIVAALVFAFLIGCNAPATALPDTEEVKAAIKEVNSSFAKAFNEGDAETLLGFYSDNPVMLPANRPAVVGKEGLRAFLQEDTAILSDFTLTTVEIEVLSSNAALERGIFTATVTTSEEAEPIQEKGKYLVYWKKDAAGAWKLHWDIFNSDLAPPGPPAESEEPEGS